MRLLVSATDNSYPDKTMLFGDHWKKFTPTANALNGNRCRARIYLRNCLRWHDSFGGLPKQARPDGSLYKTNMGTAHAAFMMVVHRLCGLSRKIGGCKSFRG